MAYYRNHMSSKWKLFHGVLLFFFLYLSVGTAEEQKKPNILFILTDDQRWDTLGCYGNTVIKTPNLDRLAAQGARLDAFYPAQPLCCPSRASFLTGFYPHQTGIDHNAKKDFDIPEEAKTVADYLNKAGYKTGFVGKAHLGRDPWKWGFQDCPVYFPGGQSPHENPEVISRSKQKQKVRGYITSIFADAAIDFIQSNKSNPWFLWLATTAPHWPYIDDPKYGYDVSKMKPPPGWPPRFKFVAETWKDYYATITMMDAEVGRVLVKLDELGLTDKTFVLMASDNGYMFESHGVEGKDSAYEGSARVPAIARWPGHIKSGSKIESPFSSVDFLPTVLDLAGEQALQNLEGVSMIPGLTSRKPQRTQIFCESSRWRMLRKDSWKYIQSTKVKRGVTEERLYNLKEDPFEMNQLIKKKESPSVLSDLRKIMDDWLHKTPTLATAYKKEAEKKQRKSKQKEEEEEADEEME